MKTNGNGRGNGEVWSELSPRLKTFSGEVLLHVDLGQVLKVDLEPELVPSVKVSAKGVPLTEAWRLLDDAIHAEFRGRVKIEMTLGVVTSIAPRERFVPRCRQEPGWGHRYRHSGLT